MNSEDRFSRQEDLKYRKIFGAVSWPGPQRGGFIVIAGRLKAGPETIVVLRECEESDLLTLIRHCSAIDNFFQCDKFLGEPKNDAARLFVTEVNAEHRPKLKERPFRLQRSRLLDLKEFFAYVLPKLKELLKLKKLDLGESRLLRDYLSQPQESDLADFELGCYPALEALALCALALDEKRDRKRQTHVKNEYARF
jgi:hypothetical protein